MRALKQYVVPMLAGLFLAACGGGGGGGDGNAGGPPPLPTVTVTANQNDVNQASTTPSGSSVTARLPFPSCRHDRSKT